MKRLFELARLGGAAARATWWENRDPTQHPDPLSLVREPVVDAWVERRADGGYQVRWKQNASSVEVCAGTEPESFPGPCVTANGAREAIITGLNPTNRPYFAIHFLDGPAAGQRIITAERYLPIEGGYNFRDLGGYQTTDGRRVRWGKVIRSGVLSDLTNSDIAYLERLGVRLVCDLRSDDENAVLPGRLHTTTSRRYWHRPLNPAGNPLTDRNTVVANLHQLKPLMQSSYTDHMIDTNARLFGDVLRAMTDPDNLPVLVHCTAGKDRTGVTAALLLLALGVPEETVIADYSLTNRYFDAIFAKVRSSNDSWLFQNMVAPHLGPIIYAWPDMLAHTLDHVRTQYGSIMDYLHDAAGISTADIQRLQANLLD